MRRPAAIVDQDVGRGAGGERRGAAGFGGDVAGDRGHLGAGFLADLVGGLLPGSRAVRAVIVNSTPARAKAIAQARPSPLLAAQTMALRPRMRKSSIPSSRL